MSATITLRQMRALWLHETVLGGRVGGGSTNDMLERYRKAENWLLEMARDDSALRLPGR